MLDTHVAAKRAPLDLDPDLHIRILRIRDELDQKVEGTLTDLSVDLEGEVLEPAKEAVFHIGEDCDRSVLMDHYGRHLDQLWTCFAGGGRALF